MLKTLHLAEVGMNKKHILELRGGDEVNGVLLLSVGELRGNLVKIAYTTKGAPGIRVYRHRVDSSTYSATRRENIWEGVC